ncbi:hypothetical protein [Porticoccus sp.]
MRDEVLVKGAEAEAVLNNQAFRDAMEQIQKEIHERLINSGFDGSLRAERYREKLNLMLYLQARLRTILVNTVASGKLKAKALDARQLRKNKSH